MIDCLCLNYDLVTEVLEVDYEPLTDITLGLHHSTAMFCGKLLRNNWKGWYCGFLVIYNSCGKVEICLVSIDSYLTGILDCVCEKGWNRSANHKLTVGSVNCLCWKVDREGQSEVKRKHEQPERPQVVVKQHMFSSRLLLIHSIRRKVDIWASSL